MGYLLWSWAKRKLQPNYTERDLSEAFRTLESLSWVGFGVGKLVRELNIQPTKEQLDLLSAIGGRELLPAT